MNERGPTWYADIAAQQLHQRISQHMKKMIDSICPEHELSHIGINRNDDTNEVVIKLHLNPIGRIRVVPEPPMGETDPRLGHSYRAIGGPDGRRK